MIPSALIELSSISVLCIEDDPVIRSAVRQAFQLHGCHDVVLAHGGEEALDLCAGRQFGLLICGYEMTPMNGIEFLRELVGAGLNDASPVIMLSGETDPATIREAQELGVRAWIGKPVSLQALLANVGDVLQLHRTGSGSDAAAAVEQHHARLLAALHRAEETNQALQLRPNETANLSQALHHAFDDASEHATSLGYQLIPRLTSRAVDLVAAMAQRPGAREPSAAQVLATLITAMKRVAEKRMAGDGAAAGARLLQAIDGLSAPPRAGLG